MVSCIYCEEPNKIICPSCIKDYKKIIKLMDKLSITLRVEDHNALTFIKILREAAKEVEE